MNKLNKNPNYQNSHGYSLFEEHHTLNFSSAPGMVLPVLYDILNPGDKIDCDLVLKSRTLPLSGSAYMELQENVDFFFVPIEQIYHNFGNQYYGIRDFSSDFFTSSSSAVPYFPYTTVQRLFTAISNLPNQYQPFTGYSSLSKSEALRLLECLGFPIKNMLYYGASEDRTVSVAPFLLAAYQKICYDYFRDDNRVANEVEAYNFDSLWNATDTSSVGVFSEERLKKLLTLHYVPYQRDFFTNIFVSPLQGQQDIGSYGSNALSQINQWLSGASLIRTLQPSTTAGQPAATTTTPTTVSSPVVGTNQPTVTQLGNIMNPAVIRTTFAAEKIFEVLRRAGKHYDAQTLANFGVKVPNGIAGEAMFINHFSTALNIGDVVSTANTAPDGELSPLGEIAGRGWSYDKGKGNKFTAPSHGILMAVYYSYPKVKYVQAGLDKLNCLVNPADWYRPQVDNLGMQPLFKYQSELQRTVVDNSAIVGWQYRFSELKQKYSRVIGNLAGSLKYWSFQKNPVRSNNASEFYVSPKVLNNLFEFEYSGVMEEEPQPFDVQYNSIYEFDPLYHDIYFNYNKSSKMSAYGLPSL